MVKTTYRETKNTLRSKNEKPPCQAAKFLKFPATCHAAAVAARGAVEDIEAWGREAPNKGRIATIHHFLAACVGKWMIPKEPLPLTGMMHQNSGRRFQDTG